MKIKTSVKISDNGFNFLKKLNLNRIKTGTSDNFLSYSDLIELIAKYFKLNNDRYLELLEVKDV